MDEDWWGLHFSIKKMASSLGTGVRHVVRSALSNANTRSSITFTPVTKTIGDEGGYAPATETDGTSRTVYYLTTEFMSQKLDSVKFGDVNTGDLNILVRDDEVIGSDGYFTLNDLNYNIQEVHPVLFNEVTIAQRLVLNKKLGQD